MLLQPTIHFQPQSSENIKYIKNVDQTFNLQHGQNQCNNFALLKFKVKKYKHILRGSFPSCYFKKSANGATIYSDRCKLITSFEQFSLFYLQCRGLYDVYHCFLLQFVGLVKH